MRLILASKTFVRETIDLASKTQEGFRIFFDIANQLIFEYSSHSVKTTIASAPSDEIIISFSKLH